MRFVLLILLCVLILFFVSPLWLAVLLAVVVAFVGGAV